MKDGLTTSERMAIALAELEIEMKKRHIEKLQMIREMIEQIAVIEKKKEEQEG